MDLLETDDFLFKRRRLLRQRAGLTDKDVHKEWLVTICFCVPARGLPIEKARSLLRIDEVLAICPRLSHERVGGTMKTCKLCLSFSTVSGAQVGVHHCRA